MPLPRRDWFNFLFNGGRGIRTDQLSGETLESINDGGTTIRRRNADDSVDEINIAGTRYASAYSYLVQPALTVPAVATDTNISDTGDGYKHVLVDDYAAPAGIEPGVDFITEWEGFITVEVKTACNLEIILRTTHKFGSPEQTLVHTRHIFHDLAGGVRQSYSMGEFFSRSTVRAGAFGDINITEADIRGPSKITYDVELRTHSRKMESARMDNVLKAFTGEGIQTASYQLQQAVQAVSGEQIPGPAGEQGPQGAFYFHLYLAGATKPSKPTAGTYNLADDTFTVTPKTWKHNEPPVAEGEFLWRISAPIDPRNDAGKTIDLTDSGRWGNVIPVTGAAADGGTADLSAVESKIAGLENVTSDLHRNKPGELWRKAKDTEVDLAWKVNSSGAIPPTGITLADADFDGNGAEVTTGSTPHVEFAIYARLPITADRSNFRLNWGDITGGLAWSLATGPSPETYSYWFCTEAGNAVNSKVKMETRDPEIPTTFNGALGDIPLHDVHQQIYTLQHLTRDLHTISRPGDWEDSDDSEVDLYIVQWPPLPHAQLVTLIDSDFDNGGSGGNIPANSSGDTQIWMVYVRLPKSADHQQYRAEIANSAYPGNTWVKTSSHTGTSGPPASATYEYWLVTAFQTLTGNLRAHVQIQDRSSTEATRYDGDASTAVAKAGGTMTGALTLHGAPTANLHAATKKYVDDNSGGTGGGGDLTQVKADARYLQLSGGTLTGTLTLDGAPTADLDAATKKYIDDHITTVNAAGGPLSDTIQIWWEEGTLLSADRNNGRQWSLGNGQEGLPFILEGGDYEVVSLDLLASKQSTTQLSQGTTIPETTIKMEKLEENGFTINTLAGWDDITDLEVTRPAWTAGDGVYGTHVSFKPTADSPILLEQGSIIRPYTTAPATSASQTTGTGHLVLLTLKRVSDGSHESTVRQFSTLPDVDGLPVGAIAYIKGGEWYRVTEAMDVKSWTDITAEVNDRATLKDRAKLPSTEDFAVGDVVLVDDEWYELAITHASEANQFAGTIGRETFRTADGEQWRGIATSQSPNGFSTDGGWTANPGDALPILLADNERHLRVGIRKSVYDTAKGSAFASTDKIAIKITYGDGSTSTDTAVMAYYSAYTRVKAGVDTQYILFQHRKTTGNYGVYGAAVGTEIVVEFYTVDGDGNATSTPFITHDAAHLHWLAWHPVPVDPDPNPTPDPDESSIGPATEPHTHHSSGMDGPSLAFLHGGYDYLWLVRRVYAGGAGDFNEWILGRPEGTFPPDGEFKQITNSSPAKLGGIGIDWLKKGSDLVPYIFGAGASVGSDDHVAASRYEITDINADPRDGTTLMVNTTNPAWGSHAGIRFVPSGVDENDVIRDLACYQEDQENHNVSGVRFWLLNTTKNRIHNLKGHTNGTSFTLISADTAHPYLDLPSTAGEYSGMALQRFGRDRILHVWHQQAKKTIAYDVASGRFWRAPHYDVDMSWVTIPHGAYAGGIEFNDAGTAIYTSFWDKDSSDPEQFRPSAAVSYINRKDISTYEFGRYHMDTALGGGHASGVIAESTIPGQPPIDVIKSIRFRLLLKRYGTSRVIATETGTPTDQMRPVLPELSRTDLITSDLFILDNSDSATRATAAAAAIAAGKCVTLGVSTENNTPKVYIGKTDRETGGSVQGTKNDWFTRARVVMFADSSGRLVRLALADVDVNGTWWYNWFVLDDIEIELLDR